MQKRIKSTDAITWGNSQTLRNTTQQLQSKNPGWETDRKMMAKSSVCCGLLLFKSKTLPDAESLLATKNRQLVVHNRQESKVSWNHQDQSLLLNPFPWIKGTLQGLTAVWERRECNRKKKYYCQGKESKEKNWKGRCKEVSAAHPGNQLVKNVFSMSEPERSSTPHRFLNKDTKIQSYYKMSDKFRLSQFNSFAKDSHWSI